MIELATNPNDLYIELESTGLQDNETFGFVICRGQGHNYKLLYNGGDFGYSFTEVINYIGNILATAQWKIEYLLLDERTEDAFKKRINENIYPVPTDDALIIDCFKIFKTTPELGPFFKGVFERENCITAQNVCEIIERLKKDRVVDTSVTPLE